MPPPNRPPVPTAWRIRGYIREHGPLTAASDFAMLSRKWRVPEAEIRNVLEFFPDLGGTTIRICDGPACRLAERDGFDAMVESAEGDIRKIACAGFCDRAPVMVDESGVVRHGNPPKEIGNSLPVIRCLASEPRLTRRLIEGPEKRSADLEAIVGTDPAVLRQRLGNLRSASANRWIAVAETEADQRFIVAHGRPGNPGSFAGRSLMEADPHGVIEGVVLTGLAVGAGEGVIVVSGENAVAFTAMEAAAEAAMKSGALDHRFEISVVSGFGAYVAGEATALLNAIEGRRGEARTRPPEPETAGLFGYPTLVESVDLLAASVPLLRGETTVDPGARLVSVTAGFERPGLVEVDREITLRQVIEDGGEDESTLDAILLGGPLGSLVLPEKWDLNCDRSALASRGIDPGHWGMMPVRWNSITELITALLDFTNRENCGKCQPCRLGSAALRDQFEAAEFDPRAFKETLGLMETASLCEFGRRVPGPLRQLIKHFGDRIG